MKVLNVVGARPNFMKVAAIIEQMRGRKGFEPLLVHTGQHYDEQLSKVFFRELGLPEPDVYLGVGSGSHAEQTARVLIEFEKVLLKEEPDLVLVVGDVNSTLAAALASVKLHFPVAHVEAGLRSYDWGMPEEVNRVLTDHISDYLLTSSPEAQENLAKEGIAKGVHFVGNTMIDTLMRFRKAAEKSDIDARLGLGKYGLVTLHRSENVDSKESIEKMAELCEIAAKYAPIVFPIHPRTRARLESFNLLSRLQKNSAVKLCEPLSYLDFVKLEAHASFVLTDSGGVQEETTVLGVPCLTLRKNTERPATITLGTNTLVGLDKAKLRASLESISKGTYKRGGKLPLWDGHAAERICEVLLKHASRKVKA